MSLGAWGRLVAVECPGFLALEGEERVAGPARPQILLRLPEFVRWRKGRRREGGEGVAPSVASTCASQTSVVVGGCAFAGAHAWRRKDAFVRDMFFRRPRFFSYVK